MHTDYCVVCGNDVPEGTQVCQECIEKYKDESNTMYLSNETAAIRKEFSHIRLYDISEQGVTRLTDDDMNDLLDFYTYLIEKRRMHNEVSEKKRPKTYSFTHL